MIAIFILKIRLDILGIPQSDKMSQTYAAVMAQMSPAFYEV